MKSARIWHDEDIPDRPWRYILRIPGRGRAYRVVGGAARTHAEAMAQIQDAWAEHTELEAS